MTDRPAAPQLLTLDVVADRLSVHRRTVERLVSSCAIRCVRIGRRALVREEDLAAYIAAHLTHPHHP